MKDIQKNLKDFMENPDTKIVYQGVFNVKDFNYLSKIINNTTEDFIIFDNKGGRRFDIMFDNILPDDNGQEKLFKVKDFIYYLLENNKGWIYSYQIDNEQTILKKIV